MLSISPVDKSLAIVPKSQLLSFVFCHNRHCQAVLTGSCNTLKVWARHCFLWCSSKRSAPATPWAPQGNANETWPPPLFSLPVAFYVRRRGRASSIRLVICSFAVNASTEFAAAFPLFFWPLEKKKRVLNANVSKWMLAWLFRKNMNRASESQAPSAARVHLYSPEKS